MYLLLYTVPKWNFLQFMADKNCHFRKAYFHNKFYKNLGIVHVPKKKTHLISDLKEQPLLHHAFNSKQIHLRMVYIRSRLNGQEASSKVEETVKNIKEETKKQQLESSLKITQIEVSDKTLEKKLTFWHKIKSEILHYYHGFRLLGLDIKVSAKLIWRILKGHDLNRREHRLLIKTTGDVFRLIPFSVFIIVPFMEFLLPVAIKIFPGLLPSTFQTPTEKEDKLKQALKVKIEMAKFLQKTLDDMSVQSTDHGSEKAKEFVNFFYKVRRTGTVATNDEIMKFSKLFEDEITLDSLNRQQLIALCRVLDIQTFGTTNFIRFLLRMKLRSLAADDRLIEKEGVDGLTRTELQQACRARGMRAYGLTEHRLREQLSQWLDLSLNKKVPPSLLLLSRALMIPETISMTDKLKATISVLPDSILARTKGAIGEKEGKLDHKTNIEIIKIEEQKIKEEREEENKIKEISNNEIHSIYKPIQTEITEKDEITASDVKALEQALDSIGMENKKMSVEKEELKELKEELAEYQEDLKELNKLKTEVRGIADVENIKVSKGAKRLFNKVNKMISKLDIVLTDLEKSERRMKIEIGALLENKQLESHAAEELVRIDELIAAIKKIQNVSDNYRVNIMAEILGKIDDDRDGAIKVEDILKVLELIGKEDVKLSTKQLNELIELLEKEEVFEIENQIQKALEKEVPENKDLKSLDTFNIVQNKEKGTGLVNSVTNEEVSGIQNYGNKNHKFREISQDSSVEQKNNNNSLILQKSAKNTSKLSPSQTKDSTHL